MEKKIVKITITLNKDYQIKEFLVDEAAYDTEDGVLIISNLGETLCYPLTSILYFTLKYV